MSHVTGTDLEDLQFDALTTSTSANTEMPSSPVPALNKAFKTTSKSVVGAVNEINTLVQSTINSFSSFTALYNSVLGDTNVSPQLLADLNTINANVLLAVVQIYKEIHGQDLANPLPVSVSVLDMLHELQALTLGASPNLSYSPTTGVLDMTATPAFDAVVLNDPPNQANHATTKQYVDDAVANSAVWTESERIPIQDAAISSYTLVYTPIQDTAAVSLNGLDLFEGTSDDYTITGSEITFNVSLTLTVGDVVHVKYKH
jgi:hypothetical protein